MPQIPEDRTQPNPDWITVPFGIASAIEWRDGRYVHVKYKMKDGKMEEMPPDQWKSAQAEIDAVVNAHKSNGP